MGMKLKRFSQINILIEEEERLFGKHNFLEKSIGSIKLGIRKARKKAADELHKGVKKDAAKGRLAGIKGSRVSIEATDLLNNSAQDRAAGRRLYRKGRDLGYTATHTNYGKGNKFVTAASHYDFKNATNGYDRVVSPQKARDYYSKKMVSDIAKAARESGRRIDYFMDPSFVSLNKNLTKGKNIISLEKYSNLKNGKKVLSLGTASHELGHAVNSSTNNINRRMRDRFSTLPKIKADREGKKKLGLVKSTIGDLAVLGEEKRATKEGLKLLKSSGASEEMMRLADKETKHYLDTYKHGTSRKFKARLRDFIDPIGSGRYDNISRYSGHRGRYLPN